MSTEQERYDVVIVGGGPVGLTLGLALTKFLPGVRLALLDRRAMAVPKDERASAIAAGVRNLFEALGVWAPMEPTANPIAEMRITDSGTGEIGRPLLLRFEGPEAPGQPFAHMVPNTTSATALLEASANALTVLEPGVVTGLTQSSSTAELALEDGRVISAGLVVAADGGRSTLRNLAGIETFTHDYRQSGIVTTIAHSEPHNDVAYEHFRPAGPFASLPLQGRRSSLVWTEKPETAKAMAATDSKVLAGIIESVMGSSLGHVTVESAVQSFPLGLTLARRSISSRLVLVGDAAHVIHPIAGQGLNLGLRDVAVLAEVLVDAARLGEDLGSAAVLERYARRRRLDTTLMTMATDALNRLFSNEVAPVRVLRDLGLSLVDRVEPLKDGFIAQAAGTRGAKLLKGLPL